jgi:hypothetical protein
MLRRNIYAEKVDGSEPPAFLAQHPILNWPYMQDNGLLNVA